MSGNTTDYRRVLYKAMETLVTGSAIKLFSVDSETKFAIRVFVSNASDGAFSIDLSDLTNTKNICRIENYNATNEMKIYRDSTTVGSVVTYTYYLSVTSGGVDTLIRKELIYGIVDDILSVGGTSMSVPSAATTLATVNSTSYNHQFLGSTYYEGTTLFSGEKLSGEASRLNVSGNVDLDLSDGLVTGTLHSTNATLDVTSNLTAGTVETGTITALTVNSFTVTGEWKNTGDISTSGKAQIGTNLTVGSSLTAGSAEIKGALVANTTDGTSTEIKGALTADSSAEIKGILTADKTAEFKGALTADSTAHIIGALTADSTANIKGNLSVGDSTHASNATVTGALTAGSATVSGALNLTSTTLTHSISGLLTAGSATINNALKVTGNTTVSGTLGAGTATLASLNAGDTTIGGTLGVTGAATLSDGLTVAKVVTLNNGLTVNGAGATFNDGMTVTGTATLSTLTSTTATVTGEMKSNAVTVNEALTAGSANVTGAVTSASVAITNALEAGSAKITGAVTSDSAKITNGISAGSAAITNALEAGSATVNGELLAASSATVNGSLTASTATVKGTLSAGGDVKVSGALDLTNGNATATIAGNLSVGDSTHASNATVTGALTAGSATIVGALNLTSITLTHSISGLLTAGSATINNALKVTGATTVSGALSAGSATLTTLGAGATTVGGTLGVTGAATLESGLTVSGGLTTLSNGLTVSGGTSELTGGLTVSNGKETALGGTLNVTGASVLGGGLTVSGGLTTLSKGLTVNNAAATLSNGLSVTGSTSFNSGLTVTGNSVITGTLSTTSNATLTSLSAGVTTIGGTLGVTGAATLNNGLTVKNALTTLNNGLTVTGDAEFSGVSVDENAIVDSITFGSGTGSQKISKLLTKPLIDPRTYTENVNGKFVWLCSTDKATLIEVNSGVLFMVRNGTTDGASNKFFIIQATSDGIYTKTGTTLANAKASNAIATLATVNSLGTYYYYSNLTRSTISGYDGDLFVGYPTSSEDNTYAYVVSQTATGIVAGSSTTDGSDTLMTAAFLPVMFSAGSMSAGATVSNLNRSEYSGTETRNGVLYQSDVNTTNVLKVNTSGKFGLTTSNGSLIWTSLTASDDGSLVTRSASNTISETNISGTNITGSQITASNGFNSNGVAKFSSGTVTFAAVNTYTSTNSNTYSGTNSYNGTDTFSNIPSFASTTSGKPPFLVSSAVKVTNLNAELLDGYDSDNFLRSLTIGTSTKTVASGSLSFTLAEIGIGNPVYFKGATSSLPAAASTTIGDMYKASGAFTLPIANSADDIAHSVKVGDTIVAKTTSIWFYIPSGDDTWRNILIAGTSIGQTLDFGVYGSSGRISVVKSDTSTESKATIDLMASGVTAASYGASADLTLSNSGSFYVPYITIDSYGRTTSAKSSKITLPADYVHPTYTTTASTPTAKALAHSGSFTALTEITASNGHVTGYVNQTYSLPAQYVLPVSSTTALGGIKLYSAVGTSAVTPSDASRTYSVLLDSNQKAYVNVPWVDTNTVYTHPTYSRSNTTSTASPAHSGTFTAIDSITSDNGHITAVNTKTVTLPAQYTHPTYSTGNTSTTASPAHSGTFTAIDGVTVSNGHVTSLNTKTVTLPAQYVLPVSSTTALGGLKLYSAVGTSAVTPSDASRTYSVLLDSNQKAYVNVPWVNNSVTAVGNHYIPSSATATKSASGASATAGATTQVVTGINTDAAGHVVSVVSGAVIDTNTTYTGGNMIALSGTSFNHKTIANTDLTAASRTYVNSLTFDDYGHVTAYTTGKETVVDSNTWRDVQFDGATIGTSNALNLIHGSNITFGVSGGSLTINADDDDTTWKNTKLKVPTAISTADSSITSVTYAPNGTSGTIDGTTIVTSLIDYLKNSIKIKKYGSDGTTEVTAESSIAKVVITIFDKTLTIEADTAGDSPDYLKVY